MRYAVVLAIAVVVHSTAPLTAKMLHAQEPPNSTTQSEKTARIGVLAFRGLKAMRIHWQPLADYLSAYVPNWQFELVPMNLVSAPQKIERNRLNFVITNPGHYVDLTERFGLSALSTRERLSNTDNHHLSEFGAVIFVRKDSMIRSLEELRSKRIAAVSPDAFAL